MRKLIPCTYILLILLQGTAYGLAIVDLVPPGQKSLPVSETLVKFHGPDVKAHKIPEPATMLFLGGGMLGVMARGRKGA